MRPTATKAHLATDDPLIPTRLFFSAVTPIVKTGIKYLELTLLLSFDRVVFMVEDLSRC